MIDKDMVEIIWLVADSLMQFMVIMNLVGYKDDLAYSSVPFLLYVLPGLDMLDGLFFKLDLRLIYTLAGDQSMYIQSQT